MKRTQALAVTLALATTLLLAGCGGSDKPSAKSSSTSSSTSSTPSGTPSGSASAQTLVPLVADGFKVSLPGKAASSEQTFTTKGGPVTATVYTAGDDTSGFFATLVPYPAGAKVNLDQAVNGIVQGYAGVVKSNQAIEFQGHPARQAAFVAATQGEQFAFYVLTVDDGGKLFQMIHAVKGPLPAQPPAILGQVASSLSFD